MSTRPSPSTAAILADLNAGRFKAAYQAAKKAMAAAPRDAGPVSLAALALTELGRPREALPLFHKAMKLDPRNPGHQTNLMQALLKLGQPAKAAQLGAQLLDRHPDDAGLTYLAAIAAMQLGDHDAALGLVDRAIALQPRNARMLDFRGALLSEMGRDRAALADFEAALALAPGTPDVLSNIARPLSRLDRLDDALAALDAALSVAPAHLPALENRAAILAEAGRLTDARLAYQMLLAHAPDHPVALAALAQLSTPADLPPLHARLKTLYSKAPGKSSARADLGFALARTARALDDAALARKTLADSNALKARLLPFDATAARSDFDAAIADFPQGTPLPAPTDLPPRPLFIVGQPRSGTTLVEQVLSTHPDVTPCGELPMAHRLIGTARAAQARFEPAAFADAYLDDLPDTARHSPAFTDKMPGNYRYLGYLARSFPQARFIHVTRDPRDVALSMWRLNFPAPDMAYAFDLAAMAETTNLYRRYMAHWRPLLGDRLLDIAYEDAVADIETASKILAAHTGLAWTPAMARPDENTAPVRTASLAQVRRKAHTGSIGAWADEADTLAPFIAGLDPALWPDLA